MYLNLEESDFSTYIYRTIPLNRLYELFQDRENTLVKPSLWEDTFENFVLKTKLRDEQNQVIEYNIHDRMYGQCWTQERASDAMWRIYSPDKQSVRIRTTIGALLDSISMATVNRAKCDHCIGKVEYVCEQELIGRATATFSENGEITFGGLFRSLLIKRRAFRHENEVRLMFCDWSETAGLQNVFKYDIEPHELISQMMLDPRLTYEEAEALKAEIRKQTGYQGDIKRSLLYRLPKSLTIDVKTKI
ncbi:hypothetical protein VCSRO70_3498 [Vibrio cholerae]|uniref:DUF2971 domain-containing protein n=1 Tax=Vibrio cholerae TaxID=666 RepID=UPI0018F06D21|nr:DUF2971 domain-containing protein [Vibrio cholerae]EJL6845488.1 DUF2971 domain-containing protein [Vibrio cholerae]EKF9201254.1 DUF2971 domain-containing protein [Vibrio cholerae]MBJ6911079.1 DUF2971 domain-containing protein [Vibrio cholerae]GHY52923.1 hypothetical protein VCSRO70_3498 [Vibrio cholerae]